jgi:hypothetical protein
MCDSSLYSSLPDDHKWTYNGSMYTDLTPRYLRFDDIRADVEFYDPDDLPGSPFTLADSALLYEDDSTDGCSRGLAFALDVVQGYYHPSRSPATVTSSTQITAAEALSYGLLNGYRVVVSMTQEQFDEFSWSRGKFGLTEYDKTGTTPPAFGDPVWWIDADEGWASGPLEWTVIVGVGEDTSNPFSVGEDVAIRYWPEISPSDCCFCRSYRMRAEIEATTEAYDHYLTPTAMDAAVERLKTKLSRLIPIHARVIDWSVTTNVVHTMTDVKNGADVFHDFTGDEFADATEILMTVEQRGDLDTGPKTMDFYLRDEVPAVVWSDTGVNTGYSDATTWYAVVTDEPVTNDIVDNNPVQIEASSTGSVTFGDVRWTFKVTRPRN